jgi:hypothetical protein
MLWDDRINFSHKIADEYTGWFNMMYMSMVNRNNLMHYRNPCFCAIIKAANKYNN